MCLRTWLWRWWWGCWLFRWWLLWRFLKNVRLEPQRTRRNTKGFRDSFTVHRRAVSVGRVALLLSHPHLKQPRRLRYDESTMTTVHVAVQPRPYEVYIENGLLARAGGLLRDLLTRSSRLF